MYEIEFAYKAEKQFKDLEKSVQIRIASSLERIKVRPYIFVKKLVGGPYFRLRVGDYRVIMRIENDKLLILVIEIGHRKNVYK